MEAQNLQESLGAFDGHFYWGSSGYFRWRAKPCISAAMTLLETTESLAAFCQDAKNEPYIAVDTEFIRDKTYYSRLCLVQIATADQAVAVDTLAPGMNLEPLYDLMADTNVLKVFHAARQDVEIFFHLSDCIPAPLFDTQVAAMVCGFGDSVGFESIVAKLAGERVDKSQRFTDWSRRPLRRKQIDYALADVIHLRPVYEKIAALLHENEREEWVEEEMAVITDPGSYEVDLMESWRRLKFRNAKPRFLAILQELAAWREKEARSRDVPRNHVLRDDVLVELASLAPQTEQELDHGRGFPRKQASNSLGRAVLAAVARGKARDPKDCPQAPSKYHLPPGLKPVVELLKVLLKTKSEAHGVAQKLIANSADLEMIAADDQADVPALHGWRRELFGEDALALKRGELALTAGKNQVALVKLS